MVNKEAISMKEKKTEKTKFPALPPRESISKGTRGQFEILSPTEGVIYKVYATYPNLPQVGPCKFRVFWKGGPYPANNVGIWLIDYRRWVTIAAIASSLSNVPTGQIGMSPLWTLPANFDPTDEWTTASSITNGGPGTYCIFIRSGNSWIYGSPFNIVWSA
jgi:hypothetical protein